MPCIVAKHAMSAGEEVGTLQNLTTTTKSYKTKILQKTKSYRLLCGTVMISTTAPTGTWMPGRGKPSQSPTPCAPNMDSVDTSSLSLKQQHRKSLNKHRNGNTIPVITVVSLLLTEITPDLDNCDL